MSGQPSFFDLDERYRALSAAGDPLERLAKLVDFELFRTEFEQALQRSDRSKGGRPPYDPVLMFRVLVLQTLYTLSDDQAEYQLRDRLSFMRFAGLALHDPAPDAKTIWLFREQLTKAGAIERLFARFDAILRDAGVLAMGGQIVDATIVQARPARLTAEEKSTIRGGGTPAGWSPAKRAQIDRDARWTLKRGRKRPAETNPSNRHQAVEIAVPIYGYKNHVGIDRAHRSDPDLDGHPRRGARRRPARAAAGRRQHGERRVGRHRLPLGRQPGRAGEACPGPAPAAAEAARQADAAQHPPRQRHTRQGQGRRRARLRRSEAAAAAGRPHCRHRPRHHQDRPRQPHL
jgi:IS5 family transposase